MAGGGDDLGLGIGVVLTVEGHGSGVGANALALAGGRSGHLVGNSSVHRLHMGSIISAGKGGRSGEIIVPLPHRLTVSMAGGGDDQSLQRRLGGTIGIAEQLAADLALPVGLHTGGLAGGRHLRHGGQGVAVGAGIGIGQLHIIDGEHTIAICVAGIGLIEVESDLNICGPIGPGISIFAVPLK